MRTVLYLRIDPRSGGADRHAPADLAAESGKVRVAATTPVALREQGPFSPIAAAVYESGALRDALAETIRTPSLRGARRARLAAFAATILPMGALLELDRELFAHGRAGFGRLAVDLVLVGFVGFELTRRTPRMPGVAALALGALTLRWLVVPARLCGRGVHPLVYAAAALMALGAVVVARLPPRSRVALELLGKLGITRSQALAASRPDEPPAALVAAAIGTAAGLPALLHLARGFGAGIYTQAALAVLFAAVAPALARRATDPESVRPKIAPRGRLLAGAGVGLALAGAAVTAARLGLDAGAELARCVERLGVEAHLALARAAEAAELARTIAAVRAELALVLVAVFVVPLAEERVYRGLLQEVLTRKFGQAYGLFAASVAFGAAHVGIYDVALYQTVLLGLGFGLAFAEGGLLAAFLAHAVWNLIQLV